MNRVRPVWISSRVPARITCMNCHEMDSSRFSGAPDKDTYLYLCAMCGFQDQVTLAQLNDPNWRGSAIMARAA